MLIFGVTAEHEFEDSAESELWPITRNKTK